MAKHMMGQAMASSYVDERKVSALQFGLLSPETIAQMSVAEIKNTQIYDQTTFQPNFHAINDPRLGVMDRDSRCITCKAGIEGCPGHFGHITLNTPVYHQGLLVFISKFLKCVCFNCSKLLAIRGDDLKCFTEKESLRKMKNCNARFNKVLKMATETSVCQSEFGGCGYKQPKFMKRGLQIDIEHRDENFDQTRDRKEILWPDQALKVLQRITDEDCILMGLNPEMGRPDWAIIRNLAVAPPPVRPSVAMSSTSRSEDDLTYAYQQVLKMNILLKEQIEKGANQTIINELRVSLQYFVATLMDNQIAGQPVQRHKSGKQIKSIRSRLKGKEGRLRGNLMGKRVDFSARTVITPDPNLALDQLGVPLSVATGMTIPETVTSQNIELLRRLVENGPSQWPGAKYIIRHDERQIDLSLLRNRSDVHLEIGYKVERHLQDGDYVLFNRQPSLHKMSIMGHRVKVLPYSTFRLNLSVTTPYNADFDGDEMNMHVPQSYETTAEIKEIMAVPRQIISPQSNKPVMGIVQDSLLGSMLMTQRDTFIEREIAMQLCMWIPDYFEQGQIVALPQPAIIKPKPLWTGKQLFSMLIPNINLAKTKNRNNQVCPKDSNVLIEKGELLQGILTKQILGPVSHSIAHIVSREYGPQRAANFLAAVQQLVNNWLINHGFSVGVQDIIVEEKAVSEGIQNTLLKYKGQVKGILNKSQQGKLVSQPGMDMIQSFESEVNKTLNDARDKSGNIALDGLSSSNRLRNMVTAGSKGSNINISQIMACVGQQNVEGKRIPFGFKHRTLPHYSKYDFGPESRGFVESSYLKGLNPAELYFHAMGGREGLIDTAVKTAETGYISRRLIKALEDVMVQYDGTVRSSRHNIYQFLYGEDGMSGEQIEDLSIDLLKASDQEVQKQCKFPVRGKSEQEDKRLSYAVTQTVFDSLLKDLDQETALESEYRQILQDRQNLRTEIFRGNSDDSIHLPVNVARMIWNAKNQFGISTQTKSDLKPEQVIRKVNALVNSLSVLPGSRNSGSKMLLDADLNARRLFNIYLRHSLCAKNVILKERLTEVSLDLVLGEIKSRFDQSRVNPGEMVGSIAAQSLGEPATQMTLNTFHFAGISAKNVTLGVPRFKEIINVSNNIKTPSLKIYLKSKYSKVEKKVLEVGTAIEHTTLGHVVSQSAIFYDPTPERTVIPEDLQLVQLYNDVPILEESCSKPSPWLLRFELDKDKMVNKGLTMKKIDDKLSETFLQQISVMVSDENSDKHVVRIRLNNIEDDSDQTVASYLKNEFEPLILHSLQLKGHPLIQKVSYTKFQNHEYCQKTGKIMIDDANWMIETDGTALASILNQKHIDSTKTVSNDNIEILNILGVEASRQSLINELRFVLSSYGIYVNYRHISTLVDVMSHRGKLTSITRHGINRVESSGPLRKCSFEETVEILLEAAMFSEKDLLSGISENVIMGQLGPFGSGCFGIKIDQTVIEENARKNFGADFLFDQYSEHGYDTPMAQGDESTAVGTPMIGITPIWETSMSSRYGPMSERQTPGHDGGGFSPAHFDFGYQHGISSPAYQSPSPGYGSPNMRNLPGNNNQSPLYHSGSPNIQSPAYKIVPQSSGHPNQISPIYRMDPTKQSYSPYYQSISPSYGLPGASSGNKISPAYSPSAVVNSPAYTNLPVQSINSGGKSSIAFYSPNFDSSTPASPIRSGYAGSKAISQADYSAGKSPYYIPPMASDSKFVSPAYQSADKLITDPNPASLGYHPSKVVIDLDYVVKEESDESD